MALSDAEKEAVTYAVLLTPLLNILSVVEGLSELEQASEWLQAVPVERIAKILARLRTDIFEIETGTIEVRRGVAIQIMEDEADDS